MSRTQSPLPFLSSIPRGSKILSALALATAATFVAAPAAQAQDVDCSTLTNPVYFPATTLLDTLLSKVSPILADPARGADQMTIVHFGLSSCLAYEKHREKVALDGKAVYYTPDGKKQSCTMPAGKMIQSDLAAMDVGGKTCLGKAAPADLKEYPSHVETLGFVVPRSSTQTAITATEAYYIMKFAGAQGRAVEPWTQPEFIFIRNPGSSTQLTIGANIGAPGTAWNSKFMRHLKSSEVRDKVNAQNATGNAERVLGILNSSKWEKAADTMKVLAFQPFNSCTFGAVYPDKTATSRDKQNVRDGHYPIWTNLRYILREDATGKPLSANGDAAAARAKNFIALMRGDRSIPNLDIAKLVVETGNIPSCAMKVKREVDGGPITKFQHPAPCECSFLELNNIPSGCTKCTTDAQCTTGGKCRAGFCEAR